MASHIDLGGLRIAVVKKDIKNVHLSVYPPAGKVRIAAPLDMELDTIRVFAISKLAWIKGQQRKIVAQERETPRDYVNRESHYVWGRRYLLSVIEHDAPPAIELKRNRLVLRLRPGTEELRRQEVLDAWYREQIRAAVPELLIKWERHMKVKAARFFVQRMKTKWGSCNPLSRSIRLNTDLAKKPPECLEYIVVHELAHLIEPTHNARFMALMDLFMPKWRHLQDELNRLPVRHEDWVY
ncbi:SprT family zinc-dependent metalloprotease [soil metagenome]